MLMEPLVSVYITTFNRVEMLKRAVDSVLQQKYGNIELFVADDGSTDATHEYLLEMEKKGLLTAIINKGSSKGACFGRNKAIGMAKGEFITGLDDDDYLQDWRIATFVEKWSSLENSADGLTKVAGLFDSMIEKMVDKEYRTHESKEVTYCQLRTSNPIGNQIFTKLDYLKSVDGFDENMPALQDWDTWIRLSSQYGLFINVNSFSYIVDAAHGEARISEKKATKIRQAFGLLETKLSPLKLSEKIKLTDTMFGYQQMNLDLKNVSYLLLGCRFRRFAQILKRTFEK